MIYDFCHALNITLKHSKRHFPQKYLKIVEEISSHFSYPQSTASFKLFLIESQKNKVLAIKNYVETRWSSFIECLDRILELKEALEIYFMQEGKSNQKQYFNSENLVMLNLFSCLANKIDYFIRYFEKDNRDMMKIVKTIQECSVSFGIFLYKFSDTESNSQNKNELLPREALYSKLEPFLKTEKDQICTEEPPKKSREEFEEYFLKIHPTFKSDLEKLGIDFKTEFFDVAEKFMSESFLSIKKHLPFRDSQTLMLLNGFSPKSDARLERLNKLGSLFTNIIPANQKIKLEQELATLRINGLDISHKIDKNPPSFLKIWEEELESYPLCYRLARAVQTLPYSTASVERGFSTLGSIKTNKRNRLSVENLEACLMAKQEFGEDSPFFNEETLIYYQNLKNQNQAGNITKKEENIPLEKEKKASPLKLKDTKLQVVQNMHDKYQMLKSIFEPQKSEELKRPRIPDNFYEQQERKRLKGLNHINQGENEVINNSIYIKSD
jgi:hypothetical protein